MLLQCRLYIYDMTDNCDVTCILAVMAMLTELTNCDGTRIHSLVLTGGNLLKLLFMVLSGLISIILCHYAKLDFTDI